MREYEEPNTTSKNRLEPRSYYIPSGVSEYHLLNGEWRFAYFANEADSLEEIEKWDVIPVPSCWQLYGYESPNYTNINYPFPVDPPYVPDENPAGIYERSFQVDRVWGKVYFVLEGVATCAYIMVNGQEVGFTQGSHLQAEFDITTFVRVGENTIRVKVLKWCFGSYLEDQDAFRYNGIFRDCYILQRPFEHLTALSVTTCENQICVETDKSATISIYSSEGAMIGRTENTQEGRFSVTNVVPWSAEKPYLYQVKVERLGEVIWQKVGFRKIEIGNDGSLRLNCMPVKLHGVNHHDTHPINGWCQTEKNLREDLLLMKKLNINCIRTSHYPPTPHFLEMCDEMGFYVILENDVETHGFLRRNSNVPYLFDVDDNDEWPCVGEMWKQELLERMQRCAILNQNRTCIIMWSTGNESGYGPNTETMLDWLRSLCDGRLLHCEDASRKGDNTKVDVVSQMYLSFEHIKQCLAEKTETKPFLLCEYSHAMGNGPGDVYDYNELFAAYPQLIGGCVWEWADHVVMSEGVPCYGGDFAGELTHDGNFCCDGMVFADRTLKAGSLEVKAAYQPLRTYYRDGELTIYNGYDFTNYSECTFVYTIERDGKEVCRKKLELVLNPHEFHTQTLEIPDVECEFGYYLQCFLYKGDVLIAHTQHEIPATIRQQRLVGCPSQYEEDTEYYYFYGEDYRYTFSKRKGTFVSLLINEKEQLAEMMKLSVWRAPTDNDKGVQTLWGNDNIWQGENLNVLFSKIYKCYFEQDILYIEGALSGISRKPFMKYTMKVHVLNTGEIQFDLDGEVRDSVIWLPRFGFEFASPISNPQIQYYGYGPYESYCDMHHGSYISMFESTAEKEYVNYVRPQEHGNHFGTKLLQVGDMQICANKPFEFQVSQYSPEVLTKATHINELKKDGNSHIRIDYKVSGIGSNSCGPELQEKYRVADKNIHFSFVMRPI